MCRADRLVVEPQFPGLGQRRVVDKHVRGAEQIAHRATGTGILEVEYHTLLVGVEIEIETVTRLRGVAFMALRKRPSLS